MIPQSKEADELRLMVIRCLALTAKFIEEGYEGVNFCPQDRRTLLELTAQGERLVERAHIHQPRRLSLAWSRP